MLRFDHVIYAVEDFDVAANHFLSEYGLASVPGGRHTGHGTGNRIVPLGSTYVELMGILDPREAESSPIGSWLKRRIEDGGGLAALCLGTDDINFISSRLGLDAVSMSRANEDGSTVQWRMVGLEVALNEPQLPFFIQWDIPAELHPGRIRASHRRIPHGISWIELRADEQRLRSWLGNHSLDLRVAVNGDPGLLAAGIKTNKGDVILR